MTSKLKIPTISKANKMATEGMKGLVGRKMTKTVKFMGEDIKIAKLSVAEVMEIQAKAKDLEGDEQNGFELLKKVIKLSVEKADELSDEDRLTVERARKIQKFLSQPFDVAEQFTGLEGKQVPLEVTIRSFKEILEGKHDELNENSFYMVGSIDEAVAKQAASK